MERTYQPLIIEKSKKIINILEEGEFFIDMEITDTSYAFNYFCEKLTEKFINGDLNFDDEGLFTEEEMDRYLHEIVIGSMLGSLKDKGLIDYIEDENNEEMFFLTKKGREVVENIKK